MIIVQDLNKNFLGSYTTLKGFLRDWNGRGARMGSYDYIRKQLRIAEKDSERFDEPIVPVKYKKFLLTRGITRKE